MDTLQKYEKHLYLFLLIGVAIYFPIFFNGFVWDDISYIVNNPEVHKINLSVLFGQNMFNSGPFYRPLPAVYFAILYSVFGKAAFFYHLVQLLLHIVGTFLLFIFLRTIFNEYIAFFFALIFLVHPINVESVAYIGSTQSELYFIPGISALLLAQKKQLSQKSFYWILFFLLLSAFTKEVGILFTLLVIAYRIIFKLGEVRKFSLFAGLMAVFYLTMRVLYGGVTYAMATYIPIAGLSLWQRLLNIPLIVVYYLKTFFFPLQLLIWQFWIVKSANFGNFILPLIFCIFLFGLFVWVGFVLFRKEKKQNKNISTYFHAYLFFFLWYLFGMSILLQIVPLDMTVADRWFYFPSVGILGMLGVVASICLPSYKTYRKQYIVVACILLSFFCIRTFFRTFDYKNDIVLYGHDIKDGNSNPALLNIYGQALFTSGKVNEGCLYIQKSVDFSPSASNVNELGDCYQVQQQYDEAVDTYSLAIDLSKNEPWHKISPLPIYLNKAQSLILAGRTDEASDFINNEALKVFPGNTQLIQMKNNIESEQNIDQNIIHY